MNRLRLFGLLLIGSWLSVAQAQFTFMPNSQRLRLLDSLRRTAQLLDRQAPGFRRDTALFFTLDRYNYHYFDINRPFSEQKKTMSFLPDSMYRMAHRLNWSAGLIIAGVRRADAMAYLGDKASAVSLYEEVLERCKQHSLPTEESRAWANLAVCYAYRKNVSPADWKKAVLCMKQSLAVARQHNDIENIHQYYNLMGDFHVIQKQYAQALPYYQAERPLMVEHQHLSGYRTNLAYLAICYLHTGQEARARPLLTEFFIISKADQGAYASYLHHIVLSEIGSYYLQHHDYQRALSYQLMYERNLNERPLFNVMGHYETMSQIYAGLHQYDQAFRYQQRYLATRDSLKPEESSRRFAQMEQQLKLERQENQVKRFQNQALLQQNKSQQNGLLFLITALLLIGGGAGSLLYSNQLKKKAMMADLRLAEERKEANSRILVAQETESQRIAADLHDDLGGTLATIRRRITDLRQYLHDPSVVRAFDDLEPLIQKSNDDLRRIAHNLMPPEFARIGLCHALEQLVHSQPLQPTRYTFITSGTEKKLLVDTELNVYRIVSELVQNINKHAQACRAAVQLLYHPDRLTITVEDDGLGSKAVETNEEGEGIGLRNSHLRADYIGAKLWREVSEGGTLVVLDIPYLPNNVNR